ncbi:DUF1499 domain-containing protein [Rhizobium sp. C4]|uniref:DUF1499 domain-containing protein n=1 Tax=Rhizobium sp. C4 TaxID=1349800 RepID=UPI001E50DBDD|nr:DUF1499 domain-containing protein [Rhizobium sp. C4]MCD2173036.1 DUF1499 domain-containing protein [Rhizobium sp. C4]
MAIEYVRPVSHVAFWARRIALFALMFMLASWLSTRFGPVLEVHFLALYLAACALAVLALLGAFIGLVNLWRVGARGGKSSIAAVLLAVPVLLPGAYAGWLYKSHAKIYEVTSDLSDPPAWIKVPDYDQLWLGPRPPADDLALREAQYVAYPGLITHRYDAALDRVVKAVREAAADRRIKFVEENVPTAIREREEEEAQPEVLGGIPVPRRRPSNVITVPGATPSKPQIPIAVFQGVVTDRITGFPYDVVIRAREAGDSTLADIRIAARYGRADLGVSAAKADAFLKALDEAMLGSADD